MKRDKFIKWFKGCSIVLVLGLILLTGGAAWGMPRYQKWVDEKLCNAIYQESAESVQKWISLGADVNSISDIELPLVTALEQNRMDIVKLLLRNGADVNIRTRSLGIPIGYANTPEQAACLVEAGANWKKYESQLLRSSVHEGNIKLLQYYLILGADPNARSPEGDTALHYLPIALGPAAGPEETERIKKTKSIAARILIEAGADVNSTIKKAVSINRLLIVGSTPLHMATKYDNLNIVIVLIEHGAKTDVVDANGNTPLDYAKGKCKALLEAHLKKQAGSKK